MKTTLTQKVDNYLETNHGIVTLLATICVFVGGLFALGMSDDYGIATLTSFGVVFFLVVFGAIIGALGAYIIAEKIGYANSAQVSRSLHKHYNAELANLQAELANAYTAHADTIDELRETYNAVVNGAYHMAWALCEDGDLRDDAFTTLKAQLTTEPHKRAQHFADTEIAFYASVENDGYEIPNPVK